MVTYKCDICGMPIKDKHDKPIMFDNVNELARYIMEHTDNTSNLPTQIGYYFYKKKDTCHVCEERLDKLFKDFVITRINEISTLDAQLIDMFPKEDDDGEDSKEAILI